jgi:hypothetical protein
MTRGGDEQTIICRNLRLKSQNHLAMKNPTLILCCVLLFFASCSKDKRVAPAIQNQIIQNYVVHGGNGDTTYTYNGYYSFGDTITRIQAQGTITFKRNGYIDLNLSGIYSPNYSYPNLDSAKYILHDTMNSHKVTKIWPQHGASGSLLFTFSIASDSLSFSDIEISCDGDMQSTYLNAQINR